MNEAQLLAGGLRAATLVGLDDDDRPLVREAGDGPAVTAWLAISADRDRLRSLAGERAKVLLATVQGLSGPVIVGILTQRAAATPDRVELRATDNIVLSTGRASVKLGADGRVEISGDYVVSKSRGPNKIRGASVAIN